MQEEIEEQEQIEEMSKEEAEESTKEIAELMKENIKNFWEISKRLKEMRDKKGFKHLTNPKTERKFESYEEYVGVLFELARRTAQAYIQAKEYMDKYHSELAHVHAPVEPQKVLLLSRLDNEEYQDKRKELDNKVFGEGISWKDLNEEIKKIRGKGEEWLRLLDVWSFKENTGEGMSNLPPEIIKNLLYYYTKEGDLVIDPFAGSGQTYEIAKEMNRECFCSDINPSKEFIKEWDVEKGFPKEIGEGDFIFLDPPYWKMVDYGEGWSNLSLEEFYAKFDRFMIDCADILKEGGKIALIIMPLKVEGKYIDLGFECYKRLEKRFKIIQRLCVPLQRNWSLDPRIKSAKENKELVTGSLRDLVIFEK